MTKRVLVLGYGAVVVGCWLVPPLATLHYPSAVVWAVTAFTGTGIWAVQQFRKAAPLGHVTRTAIALLGIPLIGLVIPGLWRTHCDLVAGFGYFLLFPLCSALFAVALAYWLTGRRARYVLLQFLGIGIALMILGPLYDLGLHPQFYTYNHVFGGVLGPIYDRFLPFRPGLIAFRGTTLLWAALLVMRGSVLRNGRWSVVSAVSVSSVALALAAAYLFADVLHINTSAQRIQQTLGSQHTTEHFDVHYDSTALDSSTVVRVGEELEFERARLVDLLDAGAEAPTGIQVYLYPNADIRARLTGAHTTSIAPVWLAVPQMHVLMQRYGSMPHEMAHLMTRPYGLPGINASWSVGLVEGWAVALEAPTRRPPPHDQVLAATPDGELAGRAEVLRRQWSPWGFWSAPAGVSYTVFGSFISSVADTHGHAALTEAYARGNLEETTRCSFDMLTTDWLRQLRGQRQVDADARPVAQRRFRIPGFFELACPYEPLPAEARYEQARAELSDHDTTSARATLHQTLAQAPDYVAARRLLADVHLETGHPDSVAQALGDSTAWGAPEWGRAAEAHVQRGAWAQAATAYRRAERATSRYAIEARTRWIARALDAEASLAHPTGPDSTWQQRLHAFETPLSADTLNVRLHRNNYLDTLRTASMPRGWRDTWRLRIHLGAVHAARRQRDAETLREAACAAQTEARTLNARPLQAVLTHAIRRAAWMDTGTFDAQCAARTGT